MSISMEPLTHEEKIRRINVGSDEVTNEFIRVYIKHMKDNGTPLSVEAIADTQKWMKEKYIRDATDTLAKQEEQEKQKEQEKLMKPVEGGKRRSSKRRRSNKRRRNTRSK